MKRVLTLTQHTDVILQWSDDNSRPLREVSASAAKGDKQDIKVSLCCFLECVFILESVF